MSVSINAADTLQPVPVEGPESLSVDSILPAVEFRIRFASPRGPIAMEAIHDNGLTTRTEGFLLTEMRRRCLLRLLDMIEREKG